MLCSQHVAPAQEQRSLGDWYFLQRTAPRTARAPPLPTRPPPKEERLEILLKYGCLINREENSFTRLPLSTLTDGSPRSPPPPSPFPHVALPLRRAYSLRDPVAFTSLVLKQDKSSESLRFSRRRPAPRLPSPYLRAESQERERERERDRLPLPSSSSETGALPFWRNPHASCSPLQVTPSLCRPQASRTQRALPEAPVTPHSLVAPALPPCLT